MGVGRGDRITEFFESVEVHDFPFLGFLLQTEFHPRAKKRKYAVNVRSLLTFSVEVEAFLEFVVCFLDSFEEVLDVFEVVIRERILVIVTSHDSSLSCCEWGSITQQVSHAKHQSQKIKRVFEK